MAKEVKPKPEEEEEKEEKEEEGEEEGGEEEEPPAPKKESYWDQFKDLLEDEDESVVASAKARHLAGRMNKRAEEAPPTQCRTEPPTPTRKKKEKPAPKKEGEKPKKGNAWL